jgi:ribosome maturation protein SDO1
MSKTVVAKYSHMGEEFEIFVDSDLAYEFITGKITDPMKPLQAEEVFKDANKGERQSQDKLNKVFNTTDIAKITEVILTKGEVPVTTEQKRRLIEEKRKQIVNIIAVNSIDPRTNAPHTPQRIEAAIEQAKVNIEPFKNAGEQVEGVLKKINPLLPIKFATAKIEVQIPASYANRCYGILKHYGLRGEEWQPNGSLKAKLEFPAGLRGEVLDKLNSMTKGEVQIRAES